MRVLALQEIGRKIWARYDARVEATLDMGTAGVVESLLRYFARTERLPGVFAYEAQARMT